jgi:hypothetical protein
MKKWMMVASLLAMFTVGALPSSVGASFQERTLVSNPKLIRNSEYLVLRGDSLNTQGGRLENVRLITDWTGRGVPLSFMWFGLYFWFPSDFQFPSGGQLTLTYKLHCSSFKLFKQSGCVSGDYYRQSLVYTGQ